MIFGRARQTLVNVFRNSETFSNDRPISGLGVYKDLAKYPSPVLLLYPMALEASRMLSQTAVVLDSLLTTAAESDFADPGRNFKIDSSPGLLIIF